VPTRQLKKPASRRRAKTSPAPASAPLDSAPRQEAQRAEADINRLLLEIARASQTAPTVEALMQAVAGLVPNLVGCDRCSLFLWDDTADGFRPAYFSHPEDQSRFETWPFIQSGVTSLVAEVRNNDRLLLLSGAEIAAQAPKEWVTGLEAHVFVVAPLRAGDRFIGVLVLYNGVQPRPFTPHAPAVIEAVRQQLAAVIHKLQLLETTQRQLRELTSLHAVASAVNEAASVDELIERATRVMGEALYPDRFSVMLVDEAAQGLHVRASRWVQKDGSGTPLGKTIASQVAASGLPRRVADVTQEPDQVVADPHTRSQLCVPMKAGERVIGVVTTESARVAAYSAADERLLLTFAAQLATAIEKLDLFETEKQQRELAEALREVGATLSATLDFEAVLDRLLDQVARVAPYDAANIMLVDTARGTVRVVRQRGYERFGADVAEDIRTTVFEIARVLNLRRMADTKQPLVIPDTAQEPTWVPVVATMHLRSWAGAPIVVHGRVIAFFSLDKVEPGFYQPRHAEHLAIFAAQAALALYNAQLFQSAEERAAELEAVRQANLRLSSTLELREVLDTILQNAIKLLPGAQNTDIFLYDGSHLSFGASLMDGEHRDRPFAEPRPEGLTNTVVREGKPVVVPDMRAHPLFVRLSPEWGGAIVGLPLKVNERVVGVMNVGYPAPHSFSESELRVLSLLGDQAAGAIESARLFEATRRQLQELIALHAVATASAEALSEVVLIERVTDIIGVMLSPLNYGVILADEAAKTLAIHPSYRDVQGPRPRRPLAFGEGVTGRTVATGAPQRILDVRRDTDYIADTPETRSELCVPLRVGGRIIGAINVESDRLGAYTEADERLLVTIAGQLATAIEKVRLFEAERMARQQAETLREVASVLNATMDPAQLMDIILDQLIRVVDYDSASIMLLSEGMLDMVAARGLRHTAQRFTSAPELAHAQEVLERALPVIIPDTQLDPRWQTVAHSEYIRCWLGVPLVVKDRVVGLLNLDHETPGFYTARDASLSVAFASQAAVALERLRLVEQTQQLLRAEHEQRSLAEALRDVGAALSAILDFDAVLDHMLEQIARVVPYDTATVMLIEQQHARVTRARGYEQLGEGALSAVMKRSFEIASTPNLRRMAETRQPLVIADVAGDPTWVKAAEPIGSWAGAPIVLEPDGVVAFFSLVKRTSGFYRAEHAERLAAFAGQAALALQNARLFQAESRRVKTLQALHETGLDLTTRLDVPALLRVIVERAARLLGTPMGGLYLVLPGQPVLEMVVSYNYPRDLTGSQLKFGEGLSGVIAQTGQPMVLDDYGCWPGRAAIFEGLPFRAVLGVPLRWQGQILGVINLIDDRPERFSPGDVEVVSLLADQAAAAIFNARLFEAERRQLKLAQTLQAVGTLLTAQMTLSEVFEQLFDLLAQVVHFDSVSIQLRDEHGQMYLAAGRGFPDFERAREIVRVLSQRRIDEAWLDQRLMVIADTLNDQRWISVEGGEYIRSWVGASLMVKGRLVGILTADSATPKAYDQTTGETVMAFANQAAVAIENSRLFEEAQRKTRELAGLYNTALTTGSVLDTGELLRRLYEQVRQLLNPDAFMVILYDSDAQELETTLAVADGTVLPRQRLTLAEGGLSGWVIQTRRPLWIADLQTDALPVNTKPLIAHARTWLGVPLVAADRTIGALSVQSFRPGAFSEADQRFLESLAAQTAVTLENARLYAEVSAKADELARLYAAAQDMGASLEPQVVLEQLARHLAEALRATSSYVMEVNWKDQSLIVLAEYWSEEAEQTERVSDLGRIYSLRDYPATAQTIASGEVRNLRLGDPDLPEAERVQLTEYGVQSSLLVPITSRGRVLGAAEIWESRAARTFTPAEKRLAQTLVRQAGGVLENAQLFKALADEKRRLEMLYHLSRNLTASLDPRVVAQNALNLISTAFGALRGMVAILIPGTDRLRLIALAGVDLARLETLDSQVNLHLGEALAGWAAAQRSVTIAVDVARDPRWVPASGLDDGVRSAISIPLVAGDELMGVLSLYSDRLGAFRAEHIPLLTAATTPVAAALQNARLFEAEARRARDLTLLNDITRAAVETSDFREMLQLLAERLSELLAADGCSIALWDETLGVPIPMAANGGLRDSQPLFRVEPATASLFGAIVEAGRFIVVDDAYTSPYVNPQVLYRFPVQSLLGLPLIGGAQKLGVALVAFNQSHRFVDAEIALGEQAAGQIALAIAKARLFDATRRHANEVTAASEILHSLNSSPDVIQAFPDIIQGLQTITGCQHVSLTLFDETREAVTIMALDRPSPGLAAGTRLRVSDSRALSLLQAGRARLTPDLTAELDFAFERALHEAGMRSRLSLPLRAGENIIGVLHLGWPRVSGYDEAQLPLLGQMADACALAIEKHWLFAQTTEALAREQRLNEVSRTISGALDLQTIIHSVVRLAVELVGAEAGTMALLAPDGAALVDVYNFNFPKDFDPEIPSKGVGLAWDIIETGKSVLLLEYGTHPQALPEWVEVGAHGFVGVPVMTGEDCLGVLGLFSLRPENRFTERDRALMESVGRQAGVAIQNARLFQATRQHAEELSAASEILRALNAAPDVALAFPGMINGLKAISRCERISLALLDESWAWFTIVAIDQARTELTQGTRLPVSSTAAAVDVLAGRPHFTPKLSDEVDYPAERALFQAGYGSRLNLPLRIGELVLGALNLVWPEPAGYNQVNLTLLGQIADAVALAVEKNRLFVETQRRAEELGVVANTSGALRAARTTEDMLPIFLHKAAEIVSAATYAIFLVEPETGDLVMRSCYPANPDVMGMRHRMGEGITGHVAATGEPYVTEDLMHDPKAIIGPHATEHLSGVRANISLPLRTQERVIGVLHVGLHDSRPFSDNEVRLLTAIAEIAGNALHRASVMETLEQRVAERTRELAQANERLKELDRLKDQFVSSVSHELRTPLTNIKLHLGLLDKRGPEVLSRYLPVLQRETERLRRLIEDLLDLSRLQAQAWPPKREPVRLDNLLSEVVVMHATRAEAKGLTLEHIMNPEAPDVSVDRAQMMQVFNNFVGNAVAYTSPGGHVTVETQSFTRDSAPGVAVHIQNSGPGIAPEDLPHLFERFYRGRTGRDSGEPGTGLGLSICKDIVERHGGQVEVESTEEEGTTFTAWLPLSAPP
jgi:GAF domain-containing protein